MFYSYSLYLLKFFLKNTVQSEKLFSWLYVIQKCISYYQPCKTYQSTFTAVFLNPGCEEPPAWSWCVWCIPWSKAVVLQDQDWETQLRCVAGFYLAFIGMTPLDPTPTGMWSKRAWASCSFTGCTSPSSRLVLNRRTPQLMSNPTPPAQVHSHC